MFRRDPASAVDDAWVRLQVGAVPGRDASRFRVPRNNKEVHVTRLKTVTTAAAIGLAFAPLAPALAQDTATDDQMQQETQMEQAQFSDDKLDSFLDAALEVQTLSESYTPRVQAAENEAEQKALVEEANTAIRGAVEDVEGITVEEYIQIGEAAQADPALAQRITAMAQEKVQPRPEG